MDFLKAAIATSKTKLSSATQAQLQQTTDSLKRKTADSTTATSEEPPTKKFKTRGEIEAEKKAAELKEKEDRLRARQAAASASTSSTYQPRDFRKEDEEALAEIAAARDAEAGMISAVEVKRRLRGYSEPITLFGETDLARFNRLKLFELHQHEKLTSSMGRKNLFAEILQQDVESEIKAAMMKDMEEERKQSSSEDGTAAAESTTATAAAAASSSIDDVTAEAAELDETGKAIKSVTSKKMDYRGKDLKRSDFATAEEFILYFFKRMLSEWEAELDARPRDVRASERGKMASAVQKQTRAFIKPLFKLLKTRTTSNDILKATEQMATACLERDYIAAQESYYTMAIGNAAWSMGVTMVSIHERASRAKIASHEIAHVLNDETQRKYIQSIKRLMTFCEEHYPPAHKKPVTNSTTTAATTSLTTTK